MMSEYTTKMTIYFYIMLTYGLDYVVVPFFGMVFRNIELEW